MLLRAKIIIAVLTTSLVTLAPIGVVAHERLMSRFNVQLCRQP
jgi:hypothetical protein